MARDGFRFGDHTELLIGDVGAPARQVHVSVDEAGHHVVTVQRELLDVGGSVVLRHGRHRHDSPIAHHHRLVVDGRPAASVDKRNRQQRKAATHLEHD